MKIVANLPAYPAVFTDGGTLTPNPSALGGMWAWVVVDAVTIGTVTVTPQERGLLLPSAGRSTITRKPPADLVVRFWDVESIESNQTETMAVARALDALPAGWSGRICADNQNALRRIKDGVKATGKIPVPVVERLAAAVARLDDVELVLMAGHPTRSELMQGYKEKQHADGSVHRFPVSRWNVHCDAQCNSVRDDAVRMGIMIPRDDAAPAEAQKPAPAAPEPEALLAVGVQTWVGIRWARASVAPGHFCRHEEHAPSDYPDKDGKRVCGTCLPGAQLRKLGGLKVADPHKHAVVA